MSIVPASCLSSAELASLGNNLVPAARKRRSRRRRIEAVNQALALVREQLGHSQQAGQTSVRLGRVA
jgi:hypothetical protein